MPTTPEEKEASRLKQQRRRAKLHDIAVSLGYTSWTKVTTAIKNGELIINPAPADTGNKGDRK
jgi:hypothetical protein